MAPIHKPYSFGKQIYEDNLLGVDNRLLDKAYVLLQASPVIANFQLS